MPQNIFAGVMPAITTPFLADGGVDHAFLAEHARWLLDSGCSGIVALGSLGEGATLTLAEKVAILATCVRSAAGRAPVVSAVAGLSTAEAVRLAQEAERIGCRGLMVLPPYVHRGTWREARAHFAAVLQATRLPCMLYNNPIAYGTDVTPPQLQELVADHGNLAAVKDSTGDVRRITAVHALLGDRLATLAGLDDMAFEAAWCGATGWVAGLANALPVESVELFEAACAGRREEAFRLYRWFLPLLRFDTVPEFVQLIKLVQQEVGRGTERVRPPRLPLGREQREPALTALRTALAQREAVVARRGAPPAKG
jgi:4-hydroxy-tetrahydrodipicolinate synthase